MSTPTHTEEWRPVPGYADYEVSDHGRVRSLDRTIVRKNGRVMRLKGKVLNPWEHGEGYLKVTVSRDANRQDFKVHTLVTAAFIGPRPEGVQVCHNDGNPANNRLDNLRYGTPKENYADRVKHGTDNSGERCGKAKLTWPQVREIRARYADGGVTQRQLALDYGVSYVAVHNIVNFKTWAHDPEENPNEQA